MDQFFAHPTWAAPFLIDACLIAPAAVRMDLATAVTVEKAIARFSESRGLRSSRNTLTPS